MKKGKRDMEEQKAVWGAIQGHVPVRPQRNVRETEASELAWAREIAGRIKEKEKKVAERSRHKIPYTTENGVFDDWSGEHRIGWWTNGFWGGMMWQLYHATGEQVFLDHALETEEKLDAVLTNAQVMDHDSGFRWLPTAVAHYRLTKDPVSRGRGLTAANDLAGRFNPVGRFIRAWNDGGDGTKAGWAIIDCMMNLPLLYWAWEETNDPRYLEIATMHAQTAQKYFIRQDGSANHIVEFNAATGEFVTAYGGQGYGVGSSWTRGQAWALYGFILSYLHTGREEYLNTAKQVANYFIVNIPESGLIPVDFRQPSDCAWEDSTAAAIAACGLLEIAGQLSEPESGVYRRAARKLLRALAGKRCCWDEERDELLEKCTAAYHDRKHEFSIIYGDYYFIEAIWKLTGEEIFLW